MCRQWILHGTSGFKRRQNRVQVDGSSTINFIPQRIRQCVENGAATAANRRLTNPTRANGRLWIRYVQRCPLHVHWNIENRGRLRVIKTPGYKMSVLRIEDPLLPNRMSDAQYGTPSNLSTQCLWVNHCTNVCNREIVRNVILSRFHVHLYLCEASNVGEALSVMRERVFRGCNQALSCQCRDRSFGYFIDVGWSFVPVVDSAESDCMLCGLRQRHAFAALAKDALVGDFILLWRRHTSWPRSPAA